MHWWVPLVGVAEIPIAFWLVFWKRTWKRGLLGTFLTEKRWEAKRLKEDQRLATRKPKPMKLSAALKMAAAEDVHEQARLASEIALDHMHKQANVLSKALDQTRRELDGYKSVRAKITAELAYCRCPDCNKKADSNLVAPNGKCIECMARALPAKIDKYREVIQRDTSQIASTLAIPPAGVTVRKVVSSRGVLNVTSNGDGMVTVKQVGPGGVFTSMVPLSSYLKDPEEFDL